MSTAVMTDTNSGMTKEEASDLGIFLLPMPIIIEDQIYYEGENLSSSEFYEFLISGKKVTTSQPSPGDVIAMWDHIFSQGYDDLVFIPMSSGLSNTCQTAISLAADYEGRVQVIDNHRISVPMWESIINALQLAGDGADAKTIKKILEEDAYQNSIYIIVDTLEYLKKGGRISAATAFLGSAMAIKPVVAVSEGEIVMLGKARGSKNGNNFLMKEIEKADGIDFTRPFCLGYTGLSDEMLQKYIKDSEALWSGHTDHLPVCTLGATIGTHVGPGAIAVAFFSPQS